MVVVTTMMLLDWPPLLRRANQLSALEHVTQRHHSIGMLGSASNKHVQAYYVSLSTLSRAICPPGPPCSSLQKTQGQLNGTNLVFCRGYECWLLP